MELKEKVMADLFDQYAVAQPKVKADDEAPKKRGRPAKEKVAEGDSDE